MLQAQLSWQRALDSNEMPMNCRARRYVELSDEAKNDINRVDEICQNTRKSIHKAICVCSAFSIADCFFAPVIMRFVTYDPDISVLACSYMRSMKDQPSLQKWVDATLKEDEIVGDDEAGVDRG